MSWNTSGRKGRARHERHSGGNQFNSQTPQAGPSDRFAIALHIRFSAPRYLFQSYRSDWTELYSRFGMVLQDPTVRWGLQNTGAIRWSALEADAKGAEVMQLAAGHGLRYGFTLSSGTLGSRSIASFVRSDRECTDGEIGAVAVDFSELHRLTLNLRSLTPRFHEALRQMSIHLTRG